LARWVLAVQWLRHVLKGVGKCDFAADDSGADETFDCDSMFESAP
jgi:hypothetical protein